MKREKTIALAGERAKLFLEIGKVAAGKGKKKEQQKLKPRVDIVIKYFDGCNEFCELYANKGMSLADHLLTIDTGK